MIKQKNILIFIILTISLSAFVFKYGGFSLENQSFSDDKYENVVNSDHKDTKSHVVIKKNHPLLKILEGDKVLGNPNAKNIIIEYSSLSCPHCAVFHETSFFEIKEKLINTGKAAFIHRNLPGDLQSLKGSVFTECLEDKDYFKFLDILFKKQISWVSDKKFQEILENIAQLGGVFDEKYASCIIDEDFQEKIIARVKEHVTSLKIKGTPTFFVNGIMLSKKPTAQNFEALMH